MKVLFLSNIPSPYRVDFFNELGKLCDLTVLFEKASSEERDDSWKDFSFRNFRGVILPGISIGVDEALNTGIAKYLRDPSFDRIVCTTFASPMGMLAITYMRMHRIPYWLESDGGRAKDGKGLKEKLKMHFIKGAQGYFSTAKEHDAYYLAYGAEPERLHRYPFTSLKQADILPALPTEDEKTVLRKELGIKEEKCIITVGRFSYLNGYGKGYDAILRAAERLPQNIGWYIIGGTPTEEFVRMTEEKELTNVHYVAFKPREELKKYYCAADVFTLMTVGDVWGLVINESMACGLPVITTDRCVAGLELVENGQNGYIVPVGDDRALARRIKDILEVPGMARKMGAVSLSRIKDYTIENMARIHMACFHEQLGERK